METILFICFELVNIISNMKFMDFIDFPNYNCNGKNIKKNGN